MSLRVGEIVELEVTQIDERGAGLGVHEDRTIVVPGLMPGERGELAIVALSRHKPVAFARLRRILRPSSDRRALPCPRHEGQALRERGRGKPACAGCPLMALEIAAQREAKRALVARAHGLELDALIGADELGYRWSSKRAAAGRAGRLILGSRVAGQTQRDWIADMRGCLVDHPRIRAAFDELEDRANALEIEPWREGAGDLRYVWAKTNGEAVVLTLITGAQQSRAARELGPWLVEQGIVAGVAHSVQAGASNVIRGEQTVTIAGEVELDLQLAGVPRSGNQRPERAGQGGGESSWELCFHEGRDRRVPPSKLVQRLGPLGFLQPNPIVAAQAYRDLVGAPPGEPDAQLGDALACDLYAGAGVTTAMLRERFAEVAACEAYPESAAALGLAPETAEEFCERWRAEGRPTPTLIIANPPRAGLGERVCAGLLGLGAARVHLMSCNPATLRADLDRLAPGYELVGLRGYDTLPQTAHVELVAWLRRRRE